jgi:hypothetical protein
MVEIGTPDPEKPEVIPITAFKPGTCALSITASNDQGHVQQIDTLTVVGSKPAALSTAYAKLA